MEKGQIDGGAGWLLLHLLSGSRECANHLDTPRFQIDAPSNRHRLDCRCTKMASVKASSTVLRQRERCSLCTEMFVTGTPALDTTYSSPGQVDSVGMWVVDCRRLSFSDEGHPALGWFAGRRCVCRRTPK